MISVNIVDTKKEHEEFYDKICKKYKTDLKKNIAISAKTKNMKKLIVLWNMVRYESKYKHLSQEDLKQNYNYIYYCGKILQNEIFQILKDNKISEEEYNKIKKELIDIV